MAFLGREESHEGRDEEKKTHARREELAERLGEGAETGAESAQRRASAKVRKAPAAIVAPDARSCGMGKVPEAGGYERRAHGRTVKRGEQAEGEHGNESSKTEGLQIVEERHGHVAVVMSMMSCVSK